LARVVIIGAGPAGIAAADALSRSAVSVTLIDDAQRPGGQLYRAPAKGLMLDMRRVLGGSFDGYEMFHNSASALCHKVDYRPGTFAWNIHGGAVHLIAGSACDSLGFDALVLATGATDRVMPIRGWTLPGVFSLGGVQALLKDQGCLIDGRVVFCGSSPLLYLAAAQYLSAGGNVAAVIDTTRFRRKLRALPDMLSAASILAQGLGYMIELKRAGVPIVHGAAIEAFEGDGRVGGIVYGVPGAKLTRIACDGVAYGHGLRPETQLAELAGCTLRYDPVQRLNVPDADIDGRAGNAIYVAGDGGVIGGGQAAAISGALAGAAVLRDFGIAAPDIDIAANRRMLQRLRRFQRGIATAFRWPHESAALLDDAVTLCRCESITVGEVRTALGRPLDAPESNRVKAATRCGMGRCQGRFCGAALAEVIASSLGKADEELGSLRVQSPIKPLPIAAAEGQPV
jgi:NADPH-dependent 2,4-dienoyl-CoA reductase/sulfur reductase-like enzyme